MPLLYVSALTEIIPSGKAVMASLCAFLDQGAPNQPA